MLPTDTFIELPDFISEPSPLYIALTLCAVFGYSFLCWRIWIEYKKGKARDKVLRERVSRRAMIARMQLPEAQPPKEKK